jgi:AraC-like DNA-binding protein
MTIAQKSVASEMARRGLQAAMQLGIGPKEFQRLTGISEAEANQSSTRISASKYIAMLNVIERLSGPINLVVQSETEYCAEPFATTIGFISTAPNLVTAFTKCIEYRALIGEVDTMSFKQAGCDFEFAFQLDGDGRTPMMALRSFEGIMHLAEEYGGKRISPGVIELVGNTVPGWAQEAHLVQCHVRFGQASNRLLFTAPWANDPYEHHHPHLHRLFCNKAKVETQRFRERDSFSFKIETFLIDLLQDEKDGAMGNGVLAHACEKFELSRSALHRRLKKEDTNFQNIIVRVKLAAAKRMLTQNERLVSEISDTLGFSSPAVFSRFFSDQLGISPSQYKSANRPF